MITANPPHFPVCSQASAQKEHGHQQQQNESPGHCKLGLTQPFMIEHGACQKRSHHEV
jgi:hypothetical protein